ncbi:hypothetical protein ABE61_04185 [Lysinibacillus sphaericus]|uniref:hypothetical protein n=1 Tax=Lysinibacillus sphaericus TaxID=1421 RepID=UPI0018CED05F|nr:hypothetical protein [Lysinibacillus sphaericus]MBG9453298.1 hypothetical protein [Lysinibacillus sphaericus]MBG9477098.1 hypothetical protein [Lysinibacillus sphaericus]MBG9591180.1 hypothetical protein [Lysinibacillus sphaericus]MBG9592002.1 hypothetical protein [Lysinibacillus sphaericus]
MIDIHDNVYYMAHIETYEKGSERVVYKESKGLFKTFRDASDWLINEDMEVFSELDCLTDDFEIYFELNNGCEIYVGYIEKLHVLKK